MLNHLTAEALTVFNLAPARADYPDAVSFFHATQEAHAALEDALRFWVATYQAGVRIVLDGKDAFFHAVDGYPNRRVVDTMAFGDFGEPALVKPAPELLQGLHSRKVHLLPFLKQQPPEAYRPFFWHLLTPEHEAEPLARHAACNGHRVAIMPVSGGCFLLHLGTCKPATVADKGSGVPGMFSEYKRLEI